MVGRLPTTTLVLSSTTLRIEILRGSHSQSPYFPRLYNKTVLVIEATYAKTPKSSTAMSGTHVRR